MKHLSPFLLLFATLLPVSGAQRGQPVDGYAAEVNGRIITVADVIGNTREAMRELIAEHQGSRAELIRKQEALFNEGLEQLIDRKLILAKFNSLDAQLPPAALQEYKRRILRDRFDNNPALLANALRQMGMTEEEWDEDLRESIVEQSMSQEYVQSKLQISPAEIREEYLNRADQLQTDIELHLLAIAFRPAREGEEAQRTRKIETVIRLLDEGGEFSSIAKEYSEGPKAASGGDQGWVRLDTLPGQIRDAVTERAVGERTDLVDLPTQSYLFKVENRRGGERQTLAEAQASIEADLMGQKREKLYQEWVQGLRGEFSVHYYNPDISAVTGE